MIVDRTRLKVVSTMLVDSVDGRVHYPCGQYSFGGRDDYACVQYSVNGPVDYDCRKSSIDDFILIEHICQTH
ncbi:hypothetical protein DPMN_156839 [Dreissena polymorpha]|uniref:Uncharacterized protein n=1 Tax=Dreissena polymorpha TaxID=45954 RepID=A0A9D4JCQ9_DREPO|nr:hypothetical protein DPMN_156839 [Dreissena polymorpha]